MEIEIWAGIVDFGDLLLLLLLSSEVGFGTPPRKQRRQQRSVPPASTVVNLIYHNPSTQKKLKRHGLSRKRPGKGT